MSIWDFIDKAYVISLDTAINRQTIVHRNLATVGLTSKTELVLVSKHPESGHAGCWQSHATVINLAKQQGHSIILVLEDDFQFTSDWHLHLPLVPDFIQRMPPNSWDFFMLGLFPLRTHHTRSTGISRVQCAVQGHAYLVNRTIINNGLHKERFQPNGPLVSIDDHLFCKAMPEADIYKYPLRAKQHARRTTSEDTNQPEYKVFALQPMIVYQIDDDVSDVCKSLKIVRQCLSQVWILRAVQRMANVIDTISLAWLLTLWLSLLLVAIVMSVGFAISHAINHVK